MLCYGTRIIYHTNNGSYAFTIIKTLPLMSTHSSTSPSTKPKNIKCVRFQEHKTVYIVPSKYDEDRSIGFEIPRGLIRKWTNSHTIITQKLNECLTNRICTTLNIQFESETHPETQSSSDCEEPLKIMPLPLSKDPPNWWEDRTPLEFLQDLTEKRLDITSIASHIDTLISTTLEDTQTTSLKFAYDRYLIDIRSIERVCQ